MWFYLVSPQDFDIVKINIIAEFSNPTNYKRWRMRDESGVRKIISIADSKGKIAQWFTLLQMPLVLKNHTQPMAVLKLVFLDILNIEYFWLSICLAAVCATWGRSTTKYTYTRCE